MTQFILHYRFTRQFVLSKGVDDFSSSVAFFATVIVLMAIYACLQTTFNQFLLPRIEAFLLRFFAFQTMKNHNDTVSAPEAPTIKDSNQATPDVIESAPIAEETISEPSEYEVLRTNAITEKNRAIQTKLEKVLSYTKQTMVAYMNEEDLNRLCAYIVEYSSGDTLQKISPVKVDSQLKSIDIMHFGWNIGKAFSKKRIHTATFIKNVFALDGILVKRSAKSAFTQPHSSRMFLSIPFVTWRSQRLNVKCHIQNQHVI